MLSRISPQFSRAAVIPDENCFSTASSGLSGLTGFRLARTCLRKRFHRRHEWVLVGEELEAQPVRVKSAHRLSHRLRDGGAHEGLQKGAIEAEVDLGHPGDRSEAPFVLGAVDAEGADVVERSRLQAEEILAVDEVAVRRVLACVADDGLVKARRGRLDHLHAAKRTRCAPSPRSCRRRKCRDARYCDAANR